MNILFIIEDNFPESGACTSLLNNILFKGGLVEEADSVEVLSAKDRYTCSDAEQYNGVTVHNCVLMSVVSNKQYKQIFFRHPFKVFRGFIEKALHKIKNNNINYSKIRAIERKIREIDSGKFDIIVAIMGYPEVAAAAMEYKRKNPDKNLVVYQVDPYSTNKGYTDLTKNERENFEKELYENSDSIITTPILFEEAKAVYTQDIINKMVPMEFPNVVPKECGVVGDNEKIRCIFTGNIYRGIRDPGYTWRLFDKVDPCISFEMIGSMPPRLCEESMQHRVAYMGSKSLKETQDELAGSDVLVNIGNSMTNQVPSKLFEYISYGKPIVNICKNRNCPTLPYLEKYPFVLNLFEEDALLEKQIQMLNGFILDSGRKRIAAEEIKKTYMTCTPQYCADQMLDVFRKFD